MGLASAPLSPQHRLQRGLLPFLEYGRELVFISCTMRKYRGSTEVPQTERTSLPDGIGWGELECSADKVPETVTFIAKKTNPLPPFVPVCSIPIRACPSRGHTVDLTIPVDQF